jgi:hypothetical protein
MKRDNEYRLEKIAHCKHRNFLLKERINMATGDVSSLQVSLKHYQEMLADYIYMKCE